MKILLIIVFSFGIVISLVLGADAQMMGSGSYGVKEEIYEHTIQEEAEGKAVWQKISDKQISCGDLTEEDFGVLGEFFMGVMLGEAHSAMNAMMMQAHGEEGEEQIHIAMGKRLSGCDPSAEVGGASGGWMPMMNMMTGSWSSPYGFNRSINPMTGFGAFSIFGGLFMILWWVLIIAGVVAIIKWLVKGGQGKSSLDIIKDRYARGEIDKKELEEKKKDLQS